MKQGSTIFLRGVVIFIGLVVLSICVLVLPAGIMSDEVGYYKPILLGLYVPAIPYFFALYQAMKLLGLIDKNKAFSQAAVNTLKYIKYCGGLISALFAAGLPYIFYVGERDDAPGVILIGLIIVFASFIIAIFAAVLERLIQNAVDMKHENDLTV